MINKGWEIPTGLEIHKVAFVAHHRIVEKNGKGWTNRGGLITDDARDYNLNFTGAMGEFMVSKALGILWNTSLHDIEGADLVTPCGKGIQVKTTIYNTGGLIHRPYEKVTDFHILVVSRNKPFSFKVAGWMPAETIRDEEYFDNPIMRNGRPPCWYVPMDKLEPMSMLRAILDK